MKLKYLIYFPVVLCLQFCHKLENFSNCKNVRLSIVLNHTDAFNLEEDIFVRKFWDKNIKVKLDLTSEEKNKILHILNQYDFFKIPNYCEYKSYRIIPANNVEIDYSSSCGSHFIKASYNRSILMSCQSEKNIGLILTNISDILYKKENVQNLPKSNVFIE